MTRMRVAVIGSGSVGESLANGFIKNGYEVLRASRDPQKLQAWAGTTGGKGTTGTFAEATKFGELITLAVKGSAAETALDHCGIDNLAGKTVIDPTNPIADKSPVNGVLQYFTGPNESLHERLQRRAPKANFVKAFSCVGHAHMVDPKFASRPTMFICGNNAAAKRRVGEILVQFGWDHEDMGPAEAARAIEPLAMLWCIPGLRDNHWNHAFKLLKA